METKLREQNERRDRERHAEEQRKMLEAQEVARREELDLQKRQDAIAIANRQAAEAIIGANETSSLVSSGEISNNQLLTAVESGVENTSMNKDGTDFCDKIDANPAANNQDQMELDEVEKEMNLIFGLNASEIFPADIGTGAGSPLDSSVVYANIVETGDGSSPDSGTQMRDLSRVRRRDSGGISLNIPLGPLKSDNDTVAKKQRLSWDTDDPGKEGSPGGGSENLDKHSSDQGDGDNVKNDVVIDPGSKDPPLSSKED